MCWGHGEDLWSVWWTFPVCGLQARALGGVAWAFGTSTAATRAAVETRW